MNEVCFAGMEEFNEEVSSSEKSRIRIGRSASQSGTQKFGRCVREAHTRDPQRNRRPVPAGVLYHLRHPLLGLERIEHAKANGGRAHLGRKPSYTRDQLNKVHDMLGQEAVSIAQIAGATGLSRQTIYRIKDDPAGAEAALAAWNYNSLSAKLRETLG